MASLTSKYQHANVLQIQRLLHRAGFPNLQNGVLDDGMDAVVKAFQQKHGLGSDGVIGDDTIKKLYDYKFNKNISERLLPSAQIFPELTFKKTIYLHHTAGRNNPYFVREGWGSANNPDRVATAFIVGGPDLKGGTELDGVTVRTLDERQWAHHLGLKAANNKQLNQESIGIEICALGPLNLVDGKFQSIISASIVVPEEQVCKLEKPWRGYQYYHKYSEKQIAETERLILTLAYLYAIPLPDREYTAVWFDINQNALKGEPGLWTHANVRSDKTDCIPQPEFIAMLNGLHEKAKTFVPDLVEELESKEGPPMMLKADDESWYYTEPLDYSSAKVQPELP